MVCSTFVNYKENFHEFVNLKVSIPRKCFMRNQLLPILLHFFIHLFSQLIYKNSDVNFHPCGFDQLLYTTPT